MLQLHLLRHAKTEQMSPTGRDFDRPLMKKGLLQRDDLKHFFKSITNIDHVWCSSAQRTRETLEALEGLPQPTFYDELYLCSHKDMLKMLWESKLDGNILIVGHNFGISDLVSYFCDSDIELRTGQYACITFDTNSWAETFGGTGTIAQLYRPEV
ncbi:MAG: histidine phosphatase family protein [bacterium]|nr:histidine phosphatase family protein [bacterium]